MVFDKSLGRTLRIREKRATQYPSTDYEDPPVIHCLYRTHTHASRLLEEPQKGSSEMMPCCGVRQKKKLLRTLSLRIVLTKYSKGTLAFVRLPQASGSQLSFIPVMTELFMTPHSRIWICSPMDGHIYVQFLRSYFI